MPPSAKGAWTVSQRPAEKLYRPLDGQDIWIDEPEMNGNSVIASGVVGTLASGYSVAEIGDYNQPVSP